jgi:alpha-ketoglutarate-dependent taurine dioxygenase
VLNFSVRYFEHPPRYQILHCLRNKVVGGTSVFVDALHAAQVLRHTHPADFDLLTKTPVAFHYINDGHHLHREHCTIELAPTTTSPARQEIRHINYSPPFQAPLSLSTPTEFYSAFKRFSDLLNHELNTYHYTLKEGDAVIFDNRRVLHARTAFRDMTEEEWQKAKTTNHCAKDGEPNRWLKGCYLEADAILDRVRVLKTRLTRRDGPQANHFEETR